MFLQCLAMHRVAYLLVIFCIGVMSSLSAWSTTASSNLAIKGLAIQEKFREPIFYAATFAEEATTNDELASLSSPFQMEARFIVEQYSARQNHQLWVGAILINNSREKLKPMAGAFKKFSASMKTPMKKGDRLLFNFVPEQGTEITLNGVKIGEIEQPDFQSALLASWYGKRPPSKEFATKIRALPSNQELREFHALRATPERVTQLRVAFESETTVVSSNSANSNSVQRPEQKLAATEFNGRSKPSGNLKIAKVDTKPVTKTSNSSKAPAKKQTKPQENPPNKVVQQKPVTKPAPKKQPPAVKKQPTSTASKPKPSNDNSTTRVAKIEKPKVEKIVTSKPPEDSDDGLDVVDQMIQLLTQDYVQEVKSYIEQQAQPVPPIRVRKTPKSKALIQITFQRDGGSVKVANSKFIRGDYNEALQKVVIESVKKLKNIPPFPESIDTNQLMVEVEIGFGRCKRSISAWVCF